MNNKSKSYAIVIMSILIGLLTVTVCALNLLKIGAGANPKFADTQAQNINNGNDKADNSDNKDNTGSDVIKEDGLDDGTDDNSSEDATEAVTDDTTEEVTDEATEAPTTEDSNVFEIPETVLGPIEDVKGNDWFDETKYSYVEPVYDSYFDDAVFIGDSRTEGLELYGGQSNMNTFSYKGLAIDKVTSEECININGKKLTVEQAVNATNYKYYYIQFGVNELGWIYEEAFANGVSKLADIILAHNPDAIIYVSSIVPVTRECSDTDKIYNLTNVKRFNDALFAMCQERDDVIYLDINASVSDKNGYLPAEASTDGKHCTADYCKRIVKYIRLHAVEKKQ